MKRLLSLIKLINITKKFDGIIALDKLNLSVEDGEYVCILGPSGAGKTTLLRIISGLLKPDKGKILIGDKIVNDIPPEKRNAVYMFQRFALFPHLNVWENVSYGPEIKNMNKEKIRNITSEVLSMVRLNDRQDAFPHELSGGMQQRVALSRGIASGARILLLDEPLGALDARLRVDLRSLLRKLVKDQNLTTIHVTHDQEEALMTADRVVVLRNGKIEQIGKPYEIYSKPKSIFISSFVGGANFIEGNILKKSDFNSTIEIQGGIKIQVSDVSRNIGEKIVVAIRREDIKLKQQKSRDTNLISGIVKSVTFIGGFIEYEIILDNDIQISSKKMLSNTLKEIKVNTKIYVSFPVEKTYVYPYPKIGLLKEIEAI